ncbi:MAG: dihydroneopterin aldolase [bacterium]
MSRNRSSLDTIHISAIEVDCIVGIYPEERKKKQPLVVDVKLGLDFSQVVKTGELRASCNYDRITDEIITLLEFREYLLLEVAAEELAALLLGLYETVTTLTIHIRKPLALKGRAQYAAVEIQRNKKEHPPRHRETIFGSLETLIETQEAGLYVVHMLAGQAIPPHYHKTTRELEWLIEGELLCNGNPFTNFSPKIWRPEQLHGYENKSDSPATLFRCTCPPLLSEDEIFIAANA